jgi:hypothetical protein
LNWKVKFCDWELEVIPCSLNLASRVPAVGGGVGVIVGVGVLVGVGVGVRVGVGVQVAVGAIGVGVLEGVGLAIGDVGVGVGETDDVVMVKVVLLSCEAWFVDP